MRVRIIIGVVAALGWFAAAGTGHAQSLVDQVVKGCKTELEKYCAQVTPGQGRVLACLYSYQDKLSGQCEYALYDAAVRLERFVAALTYVAKECDDDIDKHCGNVQIGQGRVLQCLKDKGTQVSNTCRRAMSDVGVK